MKNFSKLLLILTLCCFNWNAWGQVIAAWEMSGLPGGTDNFGPSPYNASSTDPNVTVGGLTRGSGIGTAGTGAANAWGGNNFQTTNLPDAIADNDFATFTITPNTGFMMSLSTISAYNIRRSNTGPTTGQWQYSVGAGPFNNIGSSITWGTTTTAAGNPQSLIDLSSISDLQNVPAGTTITFRIVTWGGTAPAGTWYINNILGNDLEILGSVSPISSLQLQHPISTNVSCGFTMDFGTQFIGTDTDLELRILNNGSDDIDINSLTPLTAPYSYVSPPTLPLILAPTEFIDLTIRYSPTAAVNSTSSFTISYDDGSPKTCVVNLTGTGAVVPVGSDIIVNPTFVYPTNIPYINYQAADITPANIGISSIEIAQFTIRDGGASAPDADALPTILNNLNFSIATCGAIRRIAIYDGTTEIQEIAPACNFANFSGLNLIAPDNGTKTFRVIVSFNASPITDKSQIRLTVTSTTVGAGSSTFSATNAGGAQTSIAGDNNRLNVIADRLAFVQQPSNVGVNNVMTPFPTVEARDINGNRDIDFTGVVSVTSTGTLDTSPKTATAVAGLATFNNIVHTATATSRTLTASATGLFNTTSNSFDILSTTIFQPGDLMFIGYDNAAVTGNPDDRISIVTLVDILPGTKFVYANAVYEMFAPANTRTQRWYGCNSNATNTIEAWEITYTGATNITAGSVICFNVPGVGGPTSFSINGTPSGAFSKAVAPNTAGGSANMSTTAPDPVFLMQGVFTNNGSYSTFNGRVLGAIMQGGTWYSVSDDLSSIPSGNNRRRSRIPPEVECFAVQGRTTTGVAYGYFSTAPADRTGSQPAIISNIINFIGKWTQGNGSGADDIPAANCSNTFTVGTVGIPGKWTGSDNTNWFNCRNWENFSVPTSAVDVTISPTAINNPTISSTAPNADLYFASLDGMQRVAECRNLNLDRLSLIIEASNTNRLDIHGNLNISGTGTLDMDDGNTVTADGVINILGNWNNTLGAAAFQEGNGTVRFRGNLNQTITTQGGTERFHNIVFNKTGGNVTLNATNAEVSGTATFTAGVLNAPNATTERLEFLDNATTTGANNSSYVNGWVRKVGNDDFVFPVGDDGFYAPIAISAPSNTTDHFTATYDRVYPTPYDINLKDVTLDHVGNCEHWILNRTGGSSDVFVELSYDNVRSCGITIGQESALRVARWDGTMWRDHGNVAATLIPASAIRSSAAINSFSPFTLASSNSFNPLPLELLSFKGKVNGKGEAELSWQTATEIDIAGFAVEKSTDNREFRKIGFVNATNANLNTYGFLDKDFTGLSYYRLRIVEQDNTFRYSQTISLDKTKAVQLLIYPNPATEKDFVKVALGARSEISTIKVEIVSQTGKTLAIVNDSLENTETQLSEKLQNLPKGLYIVHLQTENGEMLTSKFVKQ